MAICQSIFVCGQTTLFFVGGLIGYQLAFDKTLATLPVSAVILGTAMMTIPASLVMRRVGRRAGFMGAAVVGVSGMLTCALALYNSIFWLLCLVSSACWVNWALGRKKTNATGESGQPDEVLIAVYNRVRRLATFAIGIGLLMAILVLAVPDTFWDVKVFPIFGAFWFVVGFLATGAVNNGASEETAKRWLKLLEGLKYSVVVLIAAIAILLAIIAGSSGPHG